MSSSVHINQSAKVLKLIQTLKNTSGSNAKKDLLLKDYNFIDVFKLFLLDVYDPYINYYMSEQTSDVIPGDNCLLSFYTRNDSNNTILGIPILQKLKTRKITGNEAKIQVQAFYDSLNEPSRILFNMIMNHSIDCGVSVTTINKVYDGIIPEFKVPLCKPLNDKTVKKLKFPCTVQIKYDASRCIAVVKDGAVTFRSRNGKELHIKNDKLKTELLETTKYFTPRPYGKNEVVFDGEMCVAGADRLDSNAVITKCVRGTATEAECEDLLFVVWDAVPRVIFEFNVGALIGYDARFKELRNNLEKADAQSVIPAETYFNVPDLDTVFEYAKDAMTLGEEGIIVKNSNAIYEKKRSNDALKVKLEAESELKVVGFQEGNGKYKNKLGALICESADGLIKVSVGSGLSDAQRKNIWNDKDNFDNMIVTIKHNGIVQNMDNERSLFLPRLIEVRIDKDTADTLEQIEAAQTDAINNLLNTQ